MKTETTKENTWNTKRIYAYCICLIFSILFWFLIVLSRDYTSVISVPVKYVNLPKGKIIINKLPDYLTLEVNSFGFNLLRYKLKPATDPIIIDLGQLKVAKSSKESFLVTNSRTDRIRRQLGTNIQVLKVLPDTLFFKFDTKVLKRIPVTLRHSLDFERQYQVSDSIIIKPSNITLSGAKSILDSIKYLETELLKVSSINKTITRTVPVKLDSMLKKVELSTKRVVVTIPVEKFTEASIVIPIHLINVPPDFTGKTFPEKVKITYMISLQEFENINPALFHVIADYNESQKTNASKLKLIVAESPDFVKNIRVEPERVEFILMRK